MLEETDATVIVTMQETINNVFEFAANTVVNILPTAKNYVTSIFSQENVPGLLLLAAVSSGLRAAGEILKLSFNITPLNVQVAIKNSIPEVCKIPQVTINK